MLITYKSYENQPYAIGGINRDDVVDVMENIIAYYEPTILKQVLGDDLKATFDTNIDVEAWADLKVYLTKISKCWCYYWYLRKNVTTTTQIGEVEQSDTNIKILSPANKMIDAINDMADTIDEMIDYINDDTTGIFDEYSPEVLKFRINEYGF